MSGLGSVFSFLCCLAQLSWKHLWKSKAEGSIEMGLWWPGSPCLFLSLLAKSQPRDSYDSAQPEDFVEDRIKTSEVTLALSINTGQSLGKQREEWNVHQHRTCKGESEFCDTNLWMCSLGESKAFLKDKLCYESVRDTSWVNAPPLWLRSNCYIAFLKRFFLNLTWL